MENRTKVLSDFCYEITYENLPIEVIERTKLLILDFIGVVIRSGELESSKTMTDIASELSGPGESVVWGSPHRLQAQYAALANGTTAHGIEFDDVTCESSLHPAIVVMPAVFALAEEIGASPKSMIEAIVAGYEVMMRLGEASLDFRGNYRYFHTSGTCGVFAAAMAAGKLLKLDRQALNMAMGIAGSMSSGSMEFLTHGAWTKRLNPGWAAHSGILAAKMAQGGYVGPTTILDGDYGFLNSYTRHRRPEKLVEGLGLPYKLMETNIKVYACCRYAHAAVEGAVGLYQEGYRMKDIDKIRVSVLQAGWELVASPVEVKYNPVNVVQAQFNVPFGIAIALKKGRAGFADYIEANVGDPEIRDFLPKVEMFVDEEMEALYPRNWPAKMWITLKDGRVLERFVKHSRGGWPGPEISWEEVVDKFTGLTEGLLTEGVRSRILDQVEVFESLDDIRAFTQLLLIAKEEGHE